VQPQVDRPDGQRRDPPGTLIKILRDLGLRLEDLN
jgi:hypothetical protein